MSTTVLVTFTDSRSAADLKLQDFPVDSGSPHKVIMRLARYIGALASKKPRASMAVQVQNADGVQGSATVTTASVLANDTVTLCGVVLTATSGSTDATHFHRGVSNNADATALALCINTNTTLNKFLVATTTGASAVCTIKATNAGAHGLGYTLTSSGSTLAVSSTPFQNAASDTAATTTYHYGV